MRSHLLPVKAVLSLLRSFQPRRGWERNVSAGSEGVHPPPS
uniref:Uncharacterized protein n=1 Tax=Arundo donax TaxID=35708 RepID=A0A0A9A3M7_ARUDO